VKHAGIVESAAGKVRILRATSSDDEWEPEDDGHLTVWECLPASGAAAREGRHLYDTAVMLKKIGPKAEAVKDLAYCPLRHQRQQAADAKEATAYNALIADWTELTKAAAPSTTRSGDRQIRLDI
jgi:putative DNA methylase